MENKLQIVLHQFPFLNLVATGAFDLNVQLLQRCCSECGGKKTCDLHVGLAVTTHMWGQQHRLVGRELLRTQQHKLREILEHKACDLKCPLLPPFLHKD